MKKRKESDAIDYDTRWKVLIEKHPKAFIRRFFPDIYPSVDFSFQPRFGKQEISKLVARKKKRGGMKPDLIMEVRLFGNERRFLNIHIEAQFGAVKEFGKKMFRPFYWIFDTYGVEIAAIALFLGKSLPKNHDHFEYVFGKTKLRYDYPVEVVRDMDEEQLKQSGDLFDLAFLACKYVIRTHGEKKAFDRYELKVELVDFILAFPLGQSLDEEELQSILEFALNLLILPPNLEERFSVNLEEKYLKPDDMQYAPTLRDVNFADAILKGRLGISINEIKRLMTAEKKAEAAVLKANAAAEVEKQRAEAEKQRAEAEKQRAEAEKQKAEAEKQKAEAEKQKAEAEKQKAEAERVKTIYILHEEMNLPAERIAQLMKFELNYVVSILEKKIEIPKA